MTPTQTNWPFSDPPNVAVFTSRRIVDNGDWVYYVTHDEDDGAWQFHPHAGITPENEVKVVSLETMVKLDPSLIALADLPLGWHAWRQNPDAEWERSPRQK